MRLSSGSTTRSPPSPRTNRQAHEHFDLPTHLLLLPRRARRPFAPTSASPAAAAALPLAAAAATHHSRTRRGRAGGEDSLRRPAGIRFDRIPPRPRCRWSGTSRSTRSCGCWRRPRSPRTTSLSSTTPSSLTASSTSSRTCTARTSANSYAPIDPLLLPAATPDPCVPTSPC
jgi:hypothetical protein